ncbi:uncharacterized protein LOC119100161 [Pollicipes pollicipes]|uniref:uncharacterized protein LOC119100161 n=1 Tax=Pollicipes pollicipes TaxID=41117 RepID=UPI001884F8FE|nr:uncharacterized protein LOC119100161 [Pollicipes pollicipes]
MHSSQTAQDSNDKNSVSNIATPNDKQSDTRNAKPCGEPDPKNVALQLKKAQKSVKSASDLPEQNLKKKLDVIKAKIEARMQSFSRYPLIVNPHKVTPVDAKPSAKSSAEVKEHPSGKTPTTASRGSISTETSLTMSSSKPKPKKARRKQRPTDSLAQVVTPAAVPSKAASADPALKIQSEGPIQGRPSGSSGSQTQTDVQHGDMVAPWGSQAAAAAKPPRYVIPKLPRTGLESKPPWAGPSPAANRSAAGALPSADALPQFGDETSRLGGAVLAPGQPTVTRALDDDGTASSLPAEDDQVELMDCDGPELNEEEVLSQIAFLRGRGEISDLNWGTDTASLATSLGADATGPTPRWGADTAVPGRDRSTVTGSPGQEPAHRLTVVVDTNVLIHGVGFVLDVRDSLLDGARPLLLIPWVVVQELDKLKQDNRHRAGHEADVAQKARAAINFLLECFQAHHPFVKGQTMAEAAAARGQLKSHLADDAILECCLATGGDVMLLSDDKNLLTKVLLHGLRGASRQQLMQSADRSGTAENTPVTKDNMLCISKIVLRKALSYVIRREMAVVYGPAWSTMEGARRPWWSLRDLLACLCTYLKAVFRPVFAERWTQWQQMLRLATRAVLSQDEERALCAGVATLLPQLQPADHYGRRHGRR